MKSVFARPEVYGVLLRLLLMPIGACWDLFGYYWLSHQWAYHGVIPHDQYGGFLHLWPPFHLHAGWLWLIKPLLGPGDPWGEGLMPSASLNPFWISPDVLRTFYLQPWIPLKLFLLKLPYLLAELLLIRLLLRDAVRTAPARRVLSWVLWLNPVSLYVIYLFGSWDIIPVTLVVVSALLLPRRPVVAGLCMALAITMKLFPLMLLPFWLLVGVERRRDRPVFLAAVLVPVALWVIIGQWAGYAMASTLFRLPHYEMLVMSQIPLQLQDRLYLFFIAYVLLILHAAWCGTASFQDVVRYAASALLLFYSLCFFHPQWLLWGVPWLAVAAARQRWVIRLGLMQTVCLAVYTIQFGPTLTTYLLAPLNPDWFMSQPSPLEWLARWIDPGHLIGIAHSIFAGVSLWMVYLLVGRGPQRQMADARQA